MADVLRRVTRILASASLLAGTAAHAQWSAANDEANRQRVMASMRDTAAANDRASADRAFRSGLAAPTGSTGSGSAAYSSGGGVTTVNAPGPRRAAGPQSVVATRRVTITTQETPEQGFARLSKSAAAGDRMAQVLVGRMAYSGFGTARNDVLARKSFAAAAAQGDAEAAGFAGYLMVNGMGGPADALGGRALLKQAAEADESWAQLQYGIAMISAANAGEAVGSLKPAVVMLERAAARGDTMAQAVLGTTVYYFGIGDVARDDARAVRYLDAAAAKEQPMALAQLGQMKLSGWAPIAKDIAGGWLLIRRAAKAGDGEAQYLLGSGMISGQEGMVPNPPEGLRLLRDAATAGNAHAMGMLALILAQGTIAPKDLSTAAALARNGAKLGDTRSQVLYAEFLISGADGAVPQDLAQAAIYARRAAEKGDAWAQTTIGAMLWEGEGVVKDRTAAIGWLRKAAAQGDAQARTHLTDPEVAAFAATIK